MAEDYRTERVNIVYDHSYTEFLIPHTSLKVLVRRDGSGYVEDMGHNYVPVVFEPSQGESDHERRMYEAEIRNQLMPTEMDLMEEPRCESTVRGTGEDDEYGEEKLILTCPDHGETWALYGYDVYMCGNCLAESKIGERKSTDIYTEV